MKPQRNPMSRGCGMPIRVRTDHQMHTLPAKMRRTLARPFEISEEVDIPMPSERARPLPRPGGRAVSLRSKGSGRSSLYLSSSHGTLGFIHRLESFLEKNATLILAARPDFGDLRTQVGPVFFKTASGKSSRHFIDLLFIDTNGNRIAFLVKPSEMAQREDFCQVAEQVKEAAVPAVADEVCILTELDFPPCDAVNASRYLQFSRFPDPEAEQALSAAVENLVGATTVDAIVRMTGFGARAYRAIFKAVFHGLLRRNTGGVIDRWTLVERRASV